jgi:hypothetical protein
MIATALPMILSRKRGRGRPTMAGRGEGIMVRCHHNGLLDQVDAWIAEQDEGPSRPEAIWQPLAKALAKAKHDAARGN